MKSLEIVNEMLNYPFEERILTELATNETIIREEELETIKQSLEVLEIIKNKEVFISELKYAFKNRKNDEKILQFYNFGRGTQFQLTIEELLKLKQWLEENAYGN